MSLQEAVASPASAKEGLVGFAAGDSTEQFALTDSERFQLRQQIRDAADEIYASRRSALGVGNGAGATP